MSLEDPLFTYQRDLEPGDLRKVWEGFEEGAVGDGLLVTAGAGLSIDVDEGVGFVQGDDEPDQGLYRVSSTAAVNSDGFGSGGIAPADATKPRLDQVIARVYDDFIDSSGDYSWSLEILPGVATTGATLGNRNGAAALPSTALLLADVLVPAAASSLTSGNIADRRTGAAGNVEEVANDLADHEAATTGVHGIADTADLATDSDVAAAVSAHESDTTGVHGIADTSDLALDTDARFPTADEKAALAGTDGTPDAGNPYVTDSDARLVDSTLEPLLDAKGDLIVADADNSAARLGVGTDGHVLTADAAEATGVKWAAPAGGGGDIAIDDGGTPVDPVSDLSVTGSGGIAVSVTDDGGGAATLDVDGSGVSGGSLPSRDTAIETTASLADDASEDLEFTLAPSYRLLAIETDVAARVQIYATDADRDADVARPIGTDPTDDHGVVLDFVTGADLAWRLSPQVDGSNMDGSPTSDAYARITNLSGGTTAVETTLTFLPTES